MQVCFGDQNAFSVCFYLASLHLDIAQRKLSVATFQLTGLEITLSQEQMSP